MASHMRISDQSQNDFSSEIIDEDVRIEAQDVRSSRKYFYTPERGKAKRVKQASRRHHHSRRRKSHKGLWITLVALVVLLTAAAVVAGFYGRQLKASARNVKAQASTALEQVNDYKTSLMAGDYATAQASAEQMASIASEMRAETDGTLWRLASRVPVYGSDVQKVRTLASVFEDLSQNALIPITQELSGLSFSAIVGSEGNIDVDTLVGLVNALSSVSDVINRNAATVDALGEAKLDQVNGPLQKVRSMLSDLDDMTQGALKITPVLSRMLGAEETRHYLIVAVSPAEMRAGGGFAGSTGVLYVDNGKLEMGSFESFAGLQTDESVLPALSEDEQRIFEDHMHNRSDNANMTPNFPRAAEVYSQLWSNVKVERVDGVISVDPVFLQRILSLTGGVTISNGWEVNGDNASELLLHSVYLYYRNNEDMDAVFSEVAKLAFDRFSSTIGDVGLENIMNLIEESSLDHRLQVWMVDSEEESIMTELGISGALDTDPSKPVLGVYLNDYTYAKIGWYLDFKTEIGEGTRNADGSMSYSVTTTVHNTMTKEEADTVPPYISGSNPNRRNAGDMQTQLLIFAPAGGTISNIMVSGGGEHWHRTLYGFDIELTQFWTNLQETTTITYKVTTNSAAREDLALRMTPTCRTFK